MKQADSDTIRDEVRARYGGIARQEGSCCCGGDAANSCNPAYTADTLGYARDDIKTVPEGADMGLGCGNPHAIAALKPGETVLDLGSGGGLDCFLASKRVGAEGKVIGVDMTPDMVSKARRAAKDGGYANVEFRLGEIEHLPVADGTVDAILSNCVVNLSPDKESVFKDAFRVLRRGGRLAISDIVALKPLPAAVSGNRDALCSCVGGAVLVSDVERMLREAGFSDVRVDVKPESAEFIRTWFPGSGYEDLVASALISAVKR
ncbi:MAG: arsenite methyltransferase [Dehalococcoidia bacterium]|jgi:SAM-dependent methyltransferase|nr:arsenite methyltransferase [Dehalococcoidia bacterium]